jgi:hypothetical protein
MSRLWRGEQVPACAQAYQRSPLDPLPADRISQRRSSPSSCRDRLRAGEGEAAGQGNAEAGRDPQHVGLALFFQVVPQPGGAAVDLVPADEVDRDAVSHRVTDDRRGQLPFGGELQVQR